MRYPSGRRGKTGGRAGAERKVLLLSFVDRMVIFLGIIELPGRIAAVGWPARPLELAHSKALNCKIWN